MKLREVRQEKVTKYRNELKLKDMPEFDPLKHRIAFQADIFKPLVEGGTFISMARLFISLVQELSGNDFFEDKLAYKLKVKRPRRKKSK